MVHAYNPSTWEMEVEGSKVEASLGHIRRLIKKIKTIPPQSQQKNTKQKRKQHGHQQPQIGISLM